MSDRNINELISDYLWGTVSDEDRLLLNRMLSEDAELKSKFDALLSKKNLAERYRLYSSIEPHDAASKDARREKWIRLLRYAAVLVCAIAIGAWYFSGNKKPQPPQLTEEVLANITQAQQSGKNQATLSVEGQTLNVKSTEEATAREINLQPADKTQERVLTTHHDSEFWLTLEDGSRVHLNYGSSFTYPLTFTGGTRTVDLDGEAYFFVAKDSRHPFIINMPDGVIKVYGTEFNVNTRDDAGMTRIVLVSGSISITPRNGQEQMMKPGQMAILSNGSCTFTTADIAPYVSWNTGSFVFDNCPLEKLMRVLSRWYNKRVEFDTEDTRQIAFTGTINKYGDIEPALKAIHHVTGLRITIHNNLITISQPK